MKCINSTIKPGMAAFLSFLLKGLTVLLVLLLPLHAYSANYYWVSSATATANKWSNVANWRTTSGGATAHAALPTSADNVFFDANSFTATNNTIQIDADAACNNMDWTGVTNSPSMTGSGATLKIAGNLTLSSNMVQTGLPPDFSGTLQFISTSPGKTVTMAGKTFAAVSFNGVGGGWTLQDNLNVLGSLLLQAGTLNTNGKPVNCGFLNANAPSDEARSLVLGSSLVTVTNSQVDFRGNTSNFVLDPGTATMVMSYNSGNINLYAGSAAKTLPNLVFPLSTSPNTVNIHTSSSTAASSRITFKDITTSATGAIVNINGTALKTFGKLSFAAGNTVTFEGNTSSPAVTDNLFSSTVDFGANATVNFKGANRFDGNVTFANSTSGANVTFAQGSTFSTGTTLAMGLRTVSNFNGTSDTYTFDKVSLRHFSFATFNSGTNVFNGALSWGGVTEVWFTNSGTNTFNGTVTSTDGSSVFRLANPALSTFNQAVTLRANDTWFFSGAGNAVINSTFSASSTCGASINIRSSPSLAVAPVNFANSQTWSYVNVTNVNNSGTTVNLTSGTLSGTTGFNNTSASGRTLYWVGGTGNWSDTNHWSLTSGGAGGECVPTLKDNVFFNASSFSAANQTVTVDVALAECKNMDWTGSAARTPVFTSAAPATGKRLSIAGSMYLTGLGTQSYAGDIYFVATSVQALITGGKTLPNVYFDGTDGQWFLGDAFTSSGDIKLISGAVVTNSQDVTCVRLSVNNGDNPRRLALGNSRLTITGSGTVLDLTGDTNNFFLNSGTAQVYLTGAANMTIATGTHTKTLPDLVFTNATIGHTIDVNTGSGTNRLTFKNITLQKDGATFNVNGTSPKTYGNISIQNNTTATFNGSSLASPGDNIFSGTFTALVANDVTFNNSNTFNSNVTFGNSTTKAAFTGTVNFPNAGTALTFGTNASNVTFSGVAGTNNKLQNVTAGSGANITFSNNGTNTFNDVNLTGTSTWRFSNGGVSTVDGTFSPISACPAYINISSASGGQAKISLASNHTWNNVNVTNLENMGPGTLTVASNAADNVTNIIYTATNRTLYWVGGTGNWSDPNHWSTTSGGAGGACPPTINDDVFFNALSFPVAGATVTLDVDGSCRSIDWTGATGTPTLAGSVSRSLNMAGNMTFINDMNMTFNGMAVFTPTSAVVIPSRTITSAGKVFSGAYFMDFNATPGTWTLQDDFGVKSIGVLELRGGTLAANGQDISCGFFNTYQSSPLYGGATLADKPRKLDLSVGASTVSITGTSPTLPVLDLRGNTTNFTIDAGQSLIDLTNTGTLNVELGTEPKVLWDFRSSNTTATTININSSSAAVTHRFHDVSFASNSTVNMNGTSGKEYNKITFGDNTTSTFNGNSTVATTTDFGTGTVTRFNNTNVFNGAVTVVSTRNTTDAATFNNSTFKSTLSYTSTTEQAITRYDNNCTFEGAVSYAGPNSVMRLNNNNVFTSSAPLNFLSTAHNSNVSGTGNNLFGSTVTFAGNGNTYEVTGNNNYQGAVTFSGSINDVTFGTAATNGTPSNTVNLFRDVVNFSGDNNTVNFLSSNNSNSYTFFGKTVNIASVITPPLVTFAGRTYARGNITIGAGSPTLTAANIIIRELMDFLSAPPAAPAFMPVLTAGEQASAAAGTLLSFGDNNRIEMQGSANGFFRDMMLGANSTFQSFNVGDQTFDNITLSKYDYVELAARPAPAATIPRFIINNNINAVVNCAEWIDISSTISGVPAGIEFKGPAQSWTNVILQDMTITNAGTTPNPIVVANSSRDAGGNSITDPPNAPGVATIRFTDATGPSLYWVGGTGNWSDPNHWSTTPPPSTAPYGYPSGGTCIPSANENVFFTEWSFPSGGTCTVDVFVAYCRNMTWETTVNPAARFAGTIDKRIQIFGDLVMPDNADVNAFLGIFDFQGSAIGRNKTITSHAGRFVGPVEFNSSADTWALQDDMNVDGLALGGHITINYGKLMANDKNISLEGDWTINLPRAGLPQATFDAGSDPLNSKVTFDGDVTQNISVAVDGSSAATCQECSCSSSPFFNLLVNKTKSNPRLNINNYSITVNRDFNIMVGDVYDNGNQIRGNKSGGQMIMANNAMLRLGSNTVATVFPTCYPADKISLGAGSPSGTVLAYTGISTAANATNNASIVLYRSREEQLVSHLPVYGTLVLSSNGGAAGPYVKDATGSVEVKGSLIIRDNTTFQDMGYQVVGNSSVSASNPNRIRVENGSTLVLGTGNPAPEYPSTLPPGVPAPSATNRGIDNSATLFPTFSPIGDFTTGKMDMGATSTVIYNAGVAQSIQGGFSYGHLTLTATGASGLVNKTIVQNTATTGAITVNGNLAVNSNNHLWDDGWQITGSASRNMTVAGGSQLTVGNNTTSTQFPLNYVKANIDLAPNASPTSTVIYYSGNAATGQIMSTVPDYGHLILRDPTPTPNTAADVITKRFAPLAPVTVGGDVTIDKNNNLVDDGSQITAITANTTLLTMVQPNSFLTLGSTASATEFPIGFDARDLQDSTTVIYTSNVTQNVAGFTGTPATSANSYANLIIQGSPTPSSTVTKNLQSPGAAVRGNLTIRAMNRFNDNGYQIAGNSNTGTTITIENTGVLRLGSSTTATTFPTFSPVGNAPSATPAPGTGKMDLHPGSTVEYISGAATQYVAGGFSYGSLVALNSGSSGIVNKDLTAVTTINGSFTIFSLNRFRDMGFQITGNNTPGNRMAMAINAELVLGTPASATKFPNEFATIDLNASSTPHNTVIYNSDLAGNDIVGQNTAGTSFQYGNVTLSATAPVTKYLLHDIDVRGDLTINSNNTMDVKSGGVDHNIKLGGDWLCYDKFMARTATVELNGSAIQDINTNGQTFYNLLMNKPTSAAIASARAQLLDDCYVTNNVSFQRGHFVPEVAEVMVFGVNATVSGPYSDVTPHSVTGELGYSGFGSSQPWTQSHVIGKVRKVGNTDFVFPVGSGSEYAPMRISSLTGDATTEFTAMYYPVQAPQPTYDQSLKEFPLHHISGVEYWDLDRGVTTSSARVTLSWNTPRSGGVYYLPDLRVAHWPHGSSLWRDRGNEATTGSITKGTIQSVLINSFSPITLGSTWINNPLPVELLTFEAVRKGEVVELNWTTASEIDNEAFVIERSIDGVNFEPFKTVAAKGGNSKYAIAYQEVDAKPYSGVSYYRLKQVDRSGAVVYSKVVAVRFESQGKRAELIVYPNPNPGAQLFLQLTEQSFGECEVIINDLLGREMHRVVPASAGGKLIDLELNHRLPSGTYLIKVVTKEQTYVKTFVID